MYKNHSIICVIPVRLGSKGIPKKNIKMFHGKPLLFYAINAAKKSQYIDDIVISSDGNEILDICKKYSGVELILRDKILSTDKSSSISVAVDALLKSEQKNNTVYRIIIIVQVTNPLVLPEDINGTIKLLVDSGTDSCFSVTKFENFTPNKFLKMKENKLVPYYNNVSGIARQDLGTSFLRNGSCYAFTRTRILSKSPWGGKVMGYITPRERHIDIDDHFDFELAEFMYLRMKRI